MEPIYDVLTAVDKISTVVEIPLEEDQGVIMFTDVDTGKGAEIEIKNLSYSDDGKPNILSNLNAVIESGSQW